MAKPPTSLLPIAPQLGLPSANNPASFSYYIPNDYRSSEPRSSSRSGNTFNYTTDVGPIGSTLNFSPEPMVRDTIGWTTNFSVPYQRFMRAYTLKYMESIQLGQLMITRKCMTDQPLVNGRGTPRSGHCGRRYTITNIPVWNMLQHKGEPYPASPGDVQKAEDVWQNWYVEGSVRSEEGQVDLYQKHQDGKERLVTCIPRGFEYIYNIWGNEVTSKTPLFLILKKVDTTKTAKYILSPYSDQSATSINQGQGLGQSTTRPFQLVPWANANYDLPPPDEYRYKDEFDHVCTGIVIRVGFAERGTYTTNGNSLKNIPYSVSAMASQPKFSVYLNPERIFL